MNKIMSILEVFPACLFAVTFLVFFLIGWRRFHYPSASVNFYERWGFFLIWPCSAILPFLFFEKMNLSIYDEHNWIRLQRTFVWSHGYSIYPDIHTGPVLNSIYGPISALVYWPATWAPSYLQTVPIGVACSMVLFLAPVVFLFLFDRLLKLRLLPGVLAIFCFVFLSAILASLKRAGFTVHADAPALGLCACACAMIYWKNHFHSENISLFLGAFFAVAAFWAKQTALPLFIALGIFILLTDGWKSFLKFTLCCLVTTAISILVFTRMFDLQDLYYHMVFMPSRHPMKPHAMTAVMKGLSALGRETALIFLAALPSVGYFLCRRKKTLGIWFRTYRWSLFWLVAVCMAPFSLMAYLKVGGSINTISFVSYFGLLGTLLGIEELAAPKRHPFHKKAAGFLILFTAILMIINVPVTLHELLPNSQRKAFAVKAYEYMRAHPGTSYFPRLPLIHLLAEGKIYHETEGLSDRQWANLPVSEEQFRAYLPENLKLIGFGGEDHRRALPMITGLKKKSKKNPELPGFVVYTD